MYIAPVDREQLDCVDTKISCRKILERNRHKDFRFVQTRDFALLRGTARRNETGNRTVAAENGFPLAHACLGRISARIWTNLQKSWADCDLLTSFFSIEKRTATSHETCTGDKRTRATSHGRFRPALEESRLLKLPKVLVFGSLTKFCLSRVCSWHGQSMPAGGTQGRRGPKTQRRAAPRPQNTAPSSAE